MPKQPLETHRCNRCCYWNGNRDDARALGECRVSSPKVVGLVAQTKFHPESGQPVNSPPKAMTCFPSIGAMEWCGEFEVLSSIDEGTRFQP